jgi:hypothetical protein
MHKDITTRMTREIQALEHDLQSAQAQVQRRGKRAKGEGEGAKEGGRREGDFAIRRLIL